MKRLAVLLLFFLAFGSSSNGQDELHLNIGTQLRADDIAPSDGINDLYERLSILHLDLLFRKRFEEAPGFVEAGLFYRGELRERQVEGGQLSPFGYYPRDYVLELYHFAGVKIGGGFRYSSAGEKHVLAFPVGVQLYTSIDARPFPNQGIYFRPTYIFHGLIGEDTPWRTTLYLQSDFLIEQQPGSPYIFLLGGGLTMSYLLDYK